MRSPSHWACGSPTCSAIACTSRCPARGRRGVRRDDRDRSACIAADHPGHYLETDGTLEYPLGYRNANAAFFLIAFWPALGLAARREGIWLGRGAALAAATLCLAMGMLSQSRGSMIAGAAALCVYVAFSRDRARRVAWLALAVLPALIVLPALTDLYQRSEQRNADPRPRRRASAAPPTPPR